MTEKELRKLNRRQLLELLLLQTKQIEELKEEKQRLEHKLKNRILIAERAGSIAEAAMRLNGIFEAAQAAADQYVDSVKAKYEE